VLKIAIITYSRGLDFFTFVGDEVGLFYEGKFGDIFRVCEVQRRKNKKAGFSKKAAFVGW
jgi:hypothetical protein